MKLFVRDLDFVSMEMGFDYRYLVCLKFLINEIESSKDVPMNYIFHFQ